MSMWEPFTERARRSIVLAQEEAQRLGNNYIGTEHILLGIISEGESLAAKVLESLGVNLAKVRQEVEAIVGRGGQTVQQEMVFTPARQARDRTRLRRGAAAQPQLHRDRALASRPDPRRRGRRRPRAHELRRGPCQSSRADDVAARRRGSAGRAEGQEQDADARRVRPRPDTARARQQARSGHRPQQRDRTRHSNPLAPHEEQSGAHRRARRRQDRDRRRSRRSASSRAIFPSRCATGASSRSTWRGWLPARSIAASSKSA